MEYETLAAVDLGSNSFHLQIGRVVDEQIYLLDGLREPVRLGGGLTRDRRIDRATQLRALEALGRFGELGLERTGVSEGALRQGVLYDLLGRVQHRDLREATVNHFQRRYHVDTGQAERVWNLAQKLLVDLVPLSGEPDTQMLRWAAALHEIGISIAHAGYHKHSAYILSQADMPGFSQHEQARLARIVLAHRGKLAKPELEGLPARSPDWALIFAVRLGVLFCRRRGEAALPRINCRATESGFQMALPKIWLEEHPLTETALDAEADEWRSIGLGFEVRALPEEKLRAAG